MKKPVILFDDFEKLDIRIGQVLQAQPIEGSNKLLLLKVNLGEDYGTVEILSGIARYYSPEEITGKKFPFLANLDPKPLMGKVSNGMIMAADNGGKPVLFPINDDIPAGTIVR